MHYPINQRDKFQPDSSTLVYVPPYSADNNSATVFIELNGLHGSFINKISRKDYLIVSGNIKFNVDGKEIETVSGDIVSVQTNTKHKMNGKGSFFLTTTPPFMPETEDYIDEHSNEE